MIDSPRLVKSLVPFSGKRHIVFVNEFPTGNPHPNTENPAEKKERVVETPTLPEKVRIRPPEDLAEEDDSADDNIAKG